MQLMRHLKLTRSSVFFDEVNKIIARYPDKRDIEALSFPFLLMHHVLQGISFQSFRRPRAMKSAPFFREYAHDTKMTIPELAILFKESQAIVNGGVTLDDVMEATGNVPLHFLKTL
jgi:hypothetical protein